MTLILSACKENDQVGETLRSEYIKVYETSESKTVDDIQIPFEGVTDGKIHILSNVDLEWKHFFNPADTDTEWFTVKSVEEIEPGHTVVTYDAASILDLNALNRRTCRLSLSNPSIGLGKFLTIRQGYNRKFIEDFSDEEGQVVMLTGKETYTTEEHPELNSDFFDYISFNAWAVSENEFMSKNITLDISVSGGQFHATGLTTYRVNVPLGSGADKSNLQFLLLMGEGKRMSADTKFTFSTSNDDQVYVYLDNFAAYTVSEADMGVLYEDEDFEMEDEEGADWI